MNKNSVVGIYQYNIELKDNNFSFATCLKTEDEIIRLRKHKFYGLQKYPYRQLREFSSYMNLTKFKLELRYE